MASILVIDDDPQIGKLVEKILTRAGHEVVTASNGKEGIELVHQERFDFNVIKLRDCLIGRIKAFST